MTEGLVMFMLMLTGAVLGCVLTVMFQSLHDICREQRKMEIKREVDRRMTQWMDI